MVSAIINLEKEYDDKVAILKVQRNVKTKNIVLEQIIKEYLDTVKI